MQSRFNVSMAMQGVAEAESRRAADAAEQAYREEFNKDVSADEGQLDAEHSRALAAAQQVFNDKAVGEVISSYPPLQLIPC